METKVSRRYFVSYYIEKFFFDSNLPNLKLGQLSGKKVLKFALRGNCFYDLFTEVEIRY